VTGLIERIGDLQNSRLVASNEKDPDGPGKRSFQALYLPACLA
jgi:hypothetical protein